MGRPEDARQTQPEIDKLTDKLSGEHHTIAASVSDDVTIVYDAECPFCHHYTQLVRLRASAGDVHLVNARSDHPVIGEIEQRGFDLDQGMIVIIAERYYYGSEAMQVLAMLSTRAGWFNRLNYLVFRSSRLSNFLYPALRRGRNLILRLLGRKRIRN